MERGDKSAALNLLVPHNYDTIGKGWEHDHTIFEREIERVIQALRTDGGKTTPPPPKL